MTFTYDLETAIGQVRLEVGDTDRDAALLTDEEITFFLEEEGSVLAAAARACEALAARFARAFDITTDDQSLKRSQRAVAFRAQAKELRGRIGGTIGTVTTTRVDGYSQDIDNEETAETSAGGRVRAGYDDPDYHP